MIDVIGFVNIRKENLVSMLEGLGLIVLVLFLMGSVSSSPVKAMYNLNYGVYPESTHLTLQQGSDYTLNVYYKMGTSETFRFVFDVRSPQGIYAHTKQSINTFRDFSIPVYVKVGNIAPGDYSLILSTKVLYNGLIQEKRTNINVTVVPKQKVVFRTSDFTTAVPKLELTDISTRNLLLSPGQKQTVLLKFRNTGSASNFYLHDFVNSEDKNDVHIDFSAKSFHLDYNEEKNILVDISFDKNYNINYTSVDLYAQEQVTNNTTNLGRINITLRKENILVAYNEDNNTLAITNIGTDIASMNVKTNKRDFSFLLTPNQTYYLHADKNENDANIFLSGELFKEVSLKKGDGILAQKPKTIPVGVSSVAGLFSLGNGTSGWIIIAVFILLIIYAIYKSFFAQNAIFGKTIYAKNLNFDSKKAKA